MDVEKRLIGCTLNNPTGLIIVLNLNLGKFMNVHNENNNTDEVLTRFNFQKTKMIYVCTYKGMYI